MAKKNRIAGAVKKPDALHAALGVKKGTKIPASKLAIKKSDSTLMKRRKQFALNMKKIHK